VNQGTRERLLAAACTVFADNGFRAATIREICRRARSNVAAVNYHFGDKEQLYLAVLRHARDCAELAPVEVAVAANMTTEQRLGAFVQSFLSRVNQKGQTTWFSRLMVRELVEPTSALDAIIEESFRPRFQVLLDIVNDLGEGALDESTARRCAISVLGQCIYAHHAFPLISRLNPNITRGPEDIEALAAHIARFSVEAIRQLSNSPNVYREGNGETSSE